MGRTLRIQLTNASPDLIHDFRNFGEDVYRNLRGDYGVSIQEIDASTTEFHVREIPKREVRRVASAVRNLAEKYGDLFISIDEVNENDGG